MTTSSATASTTTTTTSSGPRVLAKDLLSLCGSYLEGEHTAEAAAKFNDPNVKEMLRNWVNGIIKIRSSTIDDLSDLKRGHFLIMLLEILSGNRLSSGYKQSRNFVEIGNNLEIFLKFMRTLGIETTDITAMALYECKYEKILLVLLLLAKAFQEQSDENKDFDKNSKKSQKRLSAKHEKNFKTMEIKLEQATVDQIYQLAGIHQAELDKEEANRKQREKDAKKLAAMVILSQAEVPKVPVYFTVHLPDGSKDIKDFDATMPLLEHLENICTAKGWLLDDYEPKTMDDKEVDLDYVLGEIKEKEIKLIKISVQAEAVQQVEAKPEKRVKRIDRGKAAQPTPQQDTSTSTTAPGRRGLVRQNSYVSIKAWDPNADEDEQESLRRVKARDNAIKAIQIKNTKSPLVVAMEREHKAMLEKLNLDGIRIPAPLSEKDMASVTKVKDVNVSALNKALRDLESFEKIYGISSDYAPENFFKDLL